MANRTSKQSIARRMDYAQLVISNALADGEIASLMAQYGQDQTKIQAGKALYEQALQLQLNQVIERSDRKRATSEMSQAWKDAQYTYDRFWPLARTALKSVPDLGISLGLQGPRKRDMAGWIRQARFFYANTLAQPHILALLTQFNIDEAQLRAGLAQVETLEQLRNTRSRERGASQLATQAHREAFDALNMWIDTFLGVAKVALRDKPQLMEKLRV